LKAKRFENDVDFFASFFSLVKRSGDKVITLFEKKNEERNITAVRTMRKLGKNKKRLTSKGFIS